MTLEIPLRVAVIGAGYMASEHLRAFSACTDVQIVGIHSRTQSRAQKLANLYGGFKVSESIDELYASTHADLLVVAVPELSCLTVCAEAFRYPWTLMIEKPVGHTLSEALEIEQLAIINQAKAYVALNRRFFR